MDDRSSTFPAQSIYNFKSMKSLDDFVCFSDADTHQGLSTRSLQLTPNGLLFSGNISTSLLPTSTAESTGYAAFRSKELPFSLFRKPYFDIAHFSNLDIRLKGDQRHYFFNVRTDDNYFKSIFQLPLRNSGEWETFRLPFKDFILTEAGIVKSEQYELDPELILTMGVSVLDRKEGPFKLEIEWIQATND